MTSIKSFLDKHFITILTFLALCLFVVIFLFYFGQNETLLYGDSRSKLLIARKVLDSLTPGLTQLGTVWLPLPEILFLPTIWNNFFFYSGLSGSLISILAAVVGTYFLAKLVWELSKDRTVTVITVLAFALNPSFLYLNSTPMSEPIFISLMIVATYLIWKWSQTNRVIFLPLAGIVTLASTLTRYDGWFFAAFAGVVIALVVFLKHKPFTQVRGTFFLFITIAFFGILLWLIYNQLIYGNMLEFTFGAGGESTAALQAIGGIAQSATKGNLLNSTSIYVYTTTLNIGIISVVCIIQAVILILIKRQYKYLVPVLLLSVPFLFNIASLFVGQSQLLVNLDPPYRLFNVRFGLAMLPLAALSFGIIASYLKKYKFVVILIVIVQIVLLMQQTPITLREPELSKASTSGAEQGELVAWLSNHESKGLTLISSLSNDTVIFDAHLPLKNVIYEGSGKYWQQALANPTSIAQRIIVSPNDSDSIWQASEKNDNFYKNYTLVFSESSVRVYDLKGNLASVAQ